MSTEYIDDLTVSQSC